MRSEPASPSVEGLSRSWLRSLRAEGKSPRTLETYGDAVRQLDAYLAAHELPQDIASVRREHVEGFISDILDRASASTANNRFRALRVFFGWCVEEEEIEVSPMARMRPPKVGTVPVPIYKPEEVARLLKVCSSNTLEDRRDAAIMRVLISTGARVSEVSGLQLTDLDLDHGGAFVTGKGDHGRFLALEPKTVKALDRYLRVRHSDSAALWIGRRGPMNTSGLQQMLKRRGEQAGVENVHAHRFRHTFAHEWLARGGTEEGLRSSAGWQSREMLARYGASAAAERARAEHGRLAIGEDL